MACPSHRPSFDHNNSIGDWGGHDLKTGRRDIEERRRRRNNIWWGKQTMRLFIM